MVNVQVMDEGTVATRPGCTQYLALANTTDGAYISNAHFFKDQNGIVYHEDTSLGFTQTGYRLRVAGMACFGVENDITFFPVCMKKYFNGNVWDWGIQGAPAPPTVTDLATSGNLTGSYSYILAYYNSLTRTIGKLSTATTALSVVSSQIRLTNFPGAAPDSQVNQIQIYRNQGGVSGSYFLLDSVPIGTTVYDDNTADQGLGDQLDNFLIPPPTCNLAAKYKARMVLADLTDNPRLMYPSLGSQPEEYDSQLYEMVADAGDTVQALVELGDYLYVFGTNALYLFQMDTNGIIYTAKPPMGQGTVNGRTVAMGTSGIYFLSDDGVYLLTGFTPVKMSDNIDALFRGTARGELSTISDLTLTSANFVGGRYHLTYMGADGDLHTVIYNERKQRWKHYTGWRYTVNPTSGSLPLVGLTGSIGQYANNTTTDNGTAYTSLCGFNLPGLAPTILTDFRGYRISAQCAGSLQVDLYDSGTLKWSAPPLVNSVYADGYEKHSVELGEYFVQPEIVISSDSPFTLKAFEAYVEPVRKSLYDYTRSTLQQGTGGTA